LPLQILKSTAKYCAAANQEIDRKKYGAADPEIGSLKLCHCPFKNRQPKALLLPFLKSTAKYCAAADLEIGRLCCCRF
jgi:hypothetical protein